MNKNYVKLALLIALGSSCSLLPMENTRWQQRNYGQDHRIDQTLGSSWPNHQTTNENRKPQKNNSTEVRAKSKRGKLFLRVCLVVGGAITACTACWYGVKYVADIWIHRVQTRSAIEAVAQCQADPLATTVFTEPSLVYNFVAQNYQDMPLSRGVLKVYESCSATKLKIEQSIEQVAQLQEKVSHNVVLYEQTQVMMAQFARFLSNVMTNITMVQQAFVELPKDTHNDNK